jgi:hypothetical protein
VDLCTYRDKRNGVVRIAGENSEHVWGISRRIVPLKDAGQYLLASFTMCRECGAYAEGSITAEVRTFHQRIQRDRTDAGYR